jgi:hypothetical protein
MRRYEDERYVKMYTRKTAEEIGWGWDGQNLFYQLNLVADRAGMVELGRHGKRGVALVVGHPDQQERVLAALDLLLADEQVVLTEGDTILVIRDFIAAQETSASPTKRKAEQRARDRAAAAAAALGSAKRAAPVKAKKPKRSRDVTSGHEKSPRAVPSRAVPCRAEPNYPPPPSEAGAPAAPAAPPRDELNPGEQLRALLDENRAEHGLPAEKHIDGARVAALVAPLVKKFGLTRVLVGHARYLRKPDKLAQRTEPEKYALELFVSQHDRHIPPEAPVVPEPVEPADEAGRLWFRVVRKLRDEGCDYAPSFLKQLEALELRGEVLVLTAPDPYFREWVAQHYATLITSTLEQVGGASSVVFEDAERAGVAA